MVWGWAGVKFHLCCILLKDAFLWRPAGCWIVPGECTAVGIDCVIRENWTDRVGEMSHKGWQKERDRDTDARELRWQQERRGGGHRMTRQGET